MEKAIIVPVLKKGFSGSVSNYRPISLTSVVSKILERILTNKFCLIDSMAFYSVILRAQTLRKFK